MNKELPKDHAEIARLAREKIHNFHKKIGGWIFSAAEILDVLECEQQEEVKEGAES